MLAYDVFGLEVHFEEVWPICFIDTDSIVSYFQFDTDEVLRVIDYKLIAYYFDFIAVFREFNRIMH